MLPTTILHASPYAQMQPPPVPVVMLLSMTNLHLPILPTLTIHEDLIVASKRVASALNIIAKDGNATNKAIRSLALLEAAEAKPGSSAPTPAKPPSSQAASARDSPLTDISGDDENSIDVSDNDSVDDTITRIPCPKSLTRKILANHEDLHQNYVHKLTKKFLDEDIALSYQDKAAVKHVYREAKIAFPELKKYAANWPTKCVLQAHLKIRANTANAAAISKLKGVKSKTKKTCL
ncbi:hypothetical protein B0H13DRAFT_1883443 [Mycena leptocephala]|nr:hypothetical protein B0H13DRAFT_1883443 [Mycena leptocephala]